MESSPLDVQSTPPSFPRRFRWSFFAFLLHLVPASSSRCLICIHLELDALVELDAAHRIAAALFSRLLRMIFIVKRSLTFELNRRWLLVLEIRDQA